MNALRCLCSLAVVMGSVSLCATAAPTTAPTTQPINFFAATRPTVRPMFPTRPGEPLPRLGDEIMVCGQLFHTGTRIILWTDPGGYDAYRVERRFVPYEQSSWEATLVAATGIKIPNRFNLRESVLTAAQIERVRGGGWDLPLLQEKVDQFVLHYDVCGISRTCFAVLQDDRGLSVHFLLDIDGTIYQTLDLKERAWHATISNSRSVGIEIANIGAYTDGEPDPFRQWYSRDRDGRMRITLPPRVGDGGLYLDSFVGRPIRDKLVYGVIQGRRRRQYDFTPEQYDALSKLTATLCTVFPKLKCDYPKDASGKLIPHKLPDDQLAAYQGVIGHYHIQTDKIDPGPAFQWDLLIGRARSLMNLPPPPPPPATEPVAPESRPSSEEQPPAPPVPPADPNPRTDRPVFDYRAR